MSAPALVCFVLWLGIGLMMRRRAGQLSTMVQGWSRGQRTLFSIGGIVGAGLILVGGLYGIWAIGWVPKSGPTPAAWAAIFVLGAVFTIVQVVAALAMVSLMGVEPAGQGNTSESRGDTIQP